MKYAQAFMTISLLLWGCLCRGQSITWSNVTNLVVNGNELLSQTGSGGAISSENFYSDGWVEFSLPTYKYAVMGLSAYNTSASIASINYGLYGHINGYLYVYENGYRIPNVGKYQPIAYQYTSTDILRVERMNGVIRYKKNGITIYTSTATSSGPLHVDCFLGQYQSRLVFVNAQFGITWTGQQSDDWNVAANWNLNRVPNTGDNVVVNACTTCPRINTDKTIGALHLNTGSSLDIGHYTLTSSEATISNTSTIKSNHGKIQSTDFVEVKNSMFTGAITLEKTGGSVNNCYGGNQFSAELKVINSSPSALQLNAHASNVIKYD